MTAKELLTKLEDERARLMNRVEEFDLKYQGCLATGDQAGADYYKTATDMVRRRLFDFIIAIQIIKDRLGD